MSGKFRSFIKYLCLVCCVLLVACKEEAKVEPRRYQVQYKNLGDTLYYSGVLQPRDVVNIPSPAEGVVVDTYFLYGQQVKKGQRLMTLNSEALTKEYTQALQDYLSHKDKLASASNELKSSEELLRLGIIPKTRYDNNKSTYNNARIAYQRSLYTLKKLIEEAHGAAIDIDRLDIANFQAVDKALQVKYNDLVVTAPKDGIALIPKTDAGGDGDKIVAGSKVKTGEILMSVGDMDGISVDIHVNEVDIDKVKVGQAVEITGVAFPKLALKGKIEQVASQAQGSGSALPKFLVKVVVPTLNPVAKKIIRVGMTVKVKLLLEQKKVLLIPAQALRHHHRKDWVQRSGKEIEVVAGNSSPGQVEIVKGLAAGDVIEYEA